MPFMVIEHFRDTPAIGRRFREKGRMIPDGVSYISSYIDPATQRCFQMMEAPSAEALQPWLNAWKDLADFEIIPVQTSQDFWATIPL
ncbi:MAG: DUF3303 domain-containing protein [Alphaproteobacteria bacterium]|nr:DUF3303 domain-containing protein [Alphaproteobacteria bacterium]